MSLQRTPRQKKPTLRGTGEADRYLVPGLRRGLEILETFGAEREVMSLSDLARAGSLSPSSAYRVIRTLEAMGYLQSVAGTKSYRLGPRVLKLGFVYLNSDEVVEAARPHLEWLRDVTDASTHLGILDDADVLYLARFASRAAVTSNIRIGSRVPAHATAMGRVLLSWLNPQSFEALLSKRILAAHTEKTIVTLPQLRRALNEDRSRGYVITRSSFQRGIFAVAAPVRDAQGKVVAAINASGLEELFGEELIETTIRARVVEAAGRISEHLGYSAGWRM